MAQAALTSLAGSGFPGVTFSSPLPGVIIASGWWQRRPYRDGRHEGFDLYAPTGTPVLAVADGVVKRWTGEFAGKSIHVEHSGGWTSRYMHLDKWIAEDGQRVRKGQVIGTVGTTGTKSSKPHLHFALLLKEHLLPLYARKFGMPKTGFGRKHGPGVAVPSEPLIPAAGYQADVIVDAKIHGIPLYVREVEKAAFPWHKAFVGVGATLLAGVILLEWRS
jgi:murein DD-endopeptidase MepM/ murein hydrolase activator NlpD